MRFRFCRSLRGGHEFLGEVVLGALLMAPAPAHSSGASPAASSWPAAQARNPAARSAAADEALIARIVAGMTLEQKVGQMTQPNIWSVTPDDVRRYYLGSILNGGGALAGKRQDGGGGAGAPLLAGLFEEAVCAPKTV